MNTWLTFTSLSEWHEWLAENHKTASEVWVQINKARSSLPGIRLGEAVEEALCFGWIDSQMHSMDPNWFILRFSPRRKNSPWSLINKNRAEELILQGRMTEAGMKAIEEAKRNGWWDKAYSSR